MAAHGQYGPVAYDLVAISRDRLREEFDRKPTNDELRIAVNLAYENHSFVECEGLKK